MAKRNQFLIPSLLLCLGLYQKALPATSKSKTGRSCHAVVSKNQDKTDNIKETASSKKSKSSSSIMIVESTDNQFREIVEIRDGEKQFPPTTYFGPEFVERYYYHQDVLGDTVAVSIYPDASPFSQKNTYNNNNGQENQNLLGYGNSHTNNRTTPKLSNQTNSQQHLPTTSDYEAARTYALKQFNRPPDAASLEQVIRVVLSNKDLLSQAKQFNVAIKNTRTVELTNYGENRYFWFKPNGQNEFVAGRVLDIHRQTSPQSFVFLVEYMTDLNPITGVRNRKVIQLEQSEFQSIYARVDSLNVDRKDAKERFHESLTPDEIETLKLANVMKLKLFGYFDIKRAPGIDSTYAKPPLETMNSITHLAIQSHILKTFGSVSDLMTPFEKQLPYANFMDIFSRLDPRYVMKRFGDSRALDTEYYWIITEDGQLKVMPAMNRGNNLKPQILRFAAGRKIFAGGTFHIESNGALNVQLEANGFQANDMSWGSHRAFQDKNPNVNEFVKIVFGIQMGREINNLGARDLENWYRNTDYNFYSKGENERNGTYNGENSDYGSNFDFTSKMNAKAKASTSQSQKVFTWDLETGVPLDLSAFAKNSNLDDRSQIVKEQWAHYVLQTNSKMTYENIKKQYRKLAMKFHPDKNKSENATEIMQLLSAANQILETIVQQ